MSRGEQLFVRGSHAVQEDIWDDTLLVKAYEKATSSWKPADVAKRIAMSTNKGARGSTKSWREGQPCRAIYEEDGEEYEACIMEIIDKEECIVNFIGYDDEAIVKLKELKPSHGEKARTQKIPNITTEPSWEEIRAIYKIQNNHSKRAASQNGELSGSAVQDSASEVKEEIMDYESVKSDRTGTEIKTEASTKKNRSKKKNKKPKGKKRTSSNPLTGLFADLPCHPAMPNLDNITSQMPLFGGLSLPMPPLPFNIVDEDEDQELLASMLTSWYMSGYYAGLYQGRINKRSKKGS